MVQKPFLGVDPGNVLLRNSQKIFDWEALQNNPEITFTKSKKFEPGQM